jgi:hypothetical protein
MTPPHQPCSINSNRHQSLRIPVARGREDITVLRAGLRLRQCGSLQGSGVNVHRPESPAMQHPQPTAYGPHWTQCVPPLLCPTSSSPAPNTEPPVSASKPRDSLSTPSSPQKPKLLWFSPSCATPAASPDTMYDDHPFFPYLLFFSCSFL